MPNAFHEYQTLRNINDGEADGLSAPTFTEQLLEKEQARAKARAANTDADTDTDADPQAGGDPSADPSALLAHLASLGVAPEKLDDIRRQLNLQQELQYQPGPGMRRGNYRIQTAANPMEHIGHLMQTYYAKKKTDALRGQQQTILDEQTEARKQFADAVARRYGLK